MNVEAVIGLIKKANRIVRFEIPGTCHSQMNYCIHCLFVWKLVVVFYP